MAKLIPLLLYHYVNVHFYVSVSLLPFIVRVSELGPMERFFGFRMRFVHGCGVLTGSSNSCASRKDATIWDTSSCMARHFFKALQKSSGLEARDSTQHKADIRADLVPY